MIYFDMGSHIWAVRPNGKGLHKVAKGYGAVVSPDGRRVYCHCGGGFGVMKPDGSHLRSIGHPPDRYRSLFFRISGVGTVVTTGEAEMSGSAILVGTASASSLTAIYTPPAGRRVELAYPSPDGTKILFEEDEDNRSTGGVWTAMADVIDSDGSNLHTIATQHTTPYNGVGIDEVNVFPCDSPFDYLDGFSEDSSAVVFTYAPCVGGYGVNTAAADGGIETTVDHFPSLHPSEYGFNPQLSEDGTKIAFTGYVEDTSSPTGLFVMRTDGTGLHRVAPRGHGEEATGWGRVVVTAGPRLHAKAH